MAETLFPKAVVVTDEVRVFTGDAVAVEDVSDELKATVRVCIAEVEALNQRMSERQARINKLRAETRAMLDSLKAF